MNKRHTLVVATLLAALMAVFLGVLTAQSAVDADTIVLYASRATRLGAFSVLADATAAGGSALHNTNANLAKVETPVAAPSSRAELTFTATAGRAYHVWIRGRAQDNSWANDSIWMQFSDSVTSTGAPVYRIGTTSATWFSLQEAGGAVISGWMWNDNGFASMGPDIYFAATGTHTLRLQPREDGIIIDQIVISPTMFYSQRPGLARNDSTVYAATGGTPPPPPPVSVCGTDPTAGSPRIAWDASVGATGYRVHFGTGSGNYGTVANVGNVLTWTLPRRPDWYLVVSAQNASGSSAFSNEVTTATLP